MRARLRSNLIVAATAMAAVGLLATPGTANPQVRSTHQEDKRPERGSSVSSDEQRSHGSSAKAGGSSSSKRRSSENYNSGGSPSSQSKSKSNQGQSTSPRSDSASSDDESSNGLKNTGTVKIAFVGDSTANNNDPHPGCPFRMDLYGFQAGTYAVTVRAHAPTGSGMLTQDSVTLSSSASGNEFQLSRTYDVTAALSSYTAHPQQGYHVRLDVTRSDAQGNGSKTKVFWLDCEAAVAGTVEAPPAGTDDNGTDDNGTDGATEVDDTSVLGVTETNTDRGALAAAASDSDSSPSVAGVLAFTGISLALLLLAALALLGAGGGLLKRRGASAKG